VVAGDSGTFSTTSWENNTLTYVSPGELLKRIRIMCGLTLRRFCLDRGLDAGRFSMIERDMLSPTEDEVDKYLKLVKPREKGRPA